MAKQLKTKIWWLVRPTNGAFTLLLAMHTCDIVSVIVIIIIIQILSDELTPGLIVFFLLMPCFFPAFMQVRAYGFSTADYRKYPNYYYDTKHTKLVFYANHDYRLEMRTWKKFHDDKFIWMYLGKSDV